MKTDYQKLLQIERNGSRRMKVFCRRARKLGWSANSIVCAVKFGAGRPVRFAKSANDEVTWRTFD